MSSRYVQPLRITIQYYFLIFSLWIGWRFSIFVEQILTGNTQAINLRSGGIEAFLPISGFLGAVAWLKGLGINLVHPAAIVIFITVLVLSFFLRRSFCSWICPVATVSETLWKTGFKLFKRNTPLPKIIDIALRAIKYLLMLFFIYSISIAMTKDDMQAFIYSDYHKMADIRLLQFFQHLSPFVILFMFSVFFASIAIKNPFCRYLCPYGALLGLVSMISPVKVTRNLDRCVSCGMCTQVCPSRIDVMHKTSVTTPECIGCWRCVSYCRFNSALSMRFAGRIVIPGFVFAVLVLFIFWGGTKIGKSAGFWNSNITSQEYRRNMGVY